MKGSARRSEEVSGGPAVGVVVDAHVGVVCAGGGADAGADVGADVGADAGADVGTASPPLDFKSSLQ